MPFTHSIQQPASKRSAQKFHSSILKSMVLSLSVLLPISSATADTWSFVSIPDLFNADYADLSGGADASIAAIFSSNYSDQLIAAPNWTPAGPNSMNAEFAAVLHQMMDDIAASTDNDPELALIAGDLIGGRWPQNRDSLNSLFGNNNTTLAQELDAASASYYTWIRTLFAESGINTVVAAIGDHDIGDNSWRNTTKANQVNNMKTDFGNHMVDPLFENLTAMDEVLNSTWEDVRLGPTEGNYDEGSYVYQKNNVLFVNVDIFRYDGGVRLGSFGAVAPEVTDDHLNWVHKVLLRAETDNTVDHVIVQGHTPILGPVNTNRSSGLLLNDGVDSGLWLTIASFGTERGGKVRAYFAGEVHATTTLLDPTSGVVQISHGALVQAIEGNFDNSDPTFLGVEVSDDGHSIDITEYTIDLDRRNDTSIVWEVDRPVSTAHDTYVSGPREIGTLFIDVRSGLLDLNAAGSLAVSNVIPSTLDFTPDPNKLYHIDNPALGLRLAALSGSEELESRTFASTGEDTQWQFVPSPTPGLWHIQRAAGGSTPRIRTDLTKSPDMEASSASGVWTRFSITVNPQNPETYLLTTPLANTENQRLRLRSNGTTDFATTINMSTWPSFVFTEVAGASFVPDPNKVYHIDNPALGLRLAALSGSEELESRTFASTGEDTQWQFVPSPTPGLWHIQRAAGGSTPRIRTDLTKSPDMEASSASGVWTRFSITVNPQNPETYLLTTPLANTEDQRLRLRSDGTANFATTNNMGTWPSFVFVEVN